MEIQRPVMRKKESRPSVRVKHPHSLFEKVRRKNMSDQIETIRSLLPCCLLKKDRLSTLSAAEDYIRSLKKEIYELGLKRTALADAIKETMPSNHTHGDDNKREEPSSTRSVIEVSSCEQHWFITM
eukprot:c22194_g1_i2 orf=3-377(-)